MIVAMSGQWTKVHGTDEGLSRLHPLVDVRRLVGAQTSLREVAETMQEHPVILIEQLGDLCHVQSKKYRQLDALVSAYIGRQGTLVSTGGVTKLGGYSGPASHLDDCHRFVEISGNQVRVLKQRGCSQTVVTLPPVSFL